MQIMLQRYTFLLEPNPSVCFKDFCIRNFFPGNPFFTKEMLANLNDISYLCTELLET